MNDIYSRNIVAELEKWMDRREILAIRGPRQSGKTTLMRIMKERLLERGVPEKNIIFLNCDDFDAAEPFVNDPKAYAKAYAPTKDKYYFFLDEYQYVQEGGRKLKVLYDSFPNLKFIISGSSSLELKDKTAQYLVGRIFYFTLYPFSFGEFISAKDERLGKIHEEKNRAVTDFITKNKGFHVKKDVFLRQISRLFEEYAVFGGYPEVVKASDAETKRIVLKNIYDTYINRDVVELLKITDTVKFRTLVALIASQQGGLLNFESLASDSKSYYREVRMLLSVLEETYVLNLLPPYHKSLSSELKKNPKSYFLDSGLRNYVIKNFNALSFREDRGKLAEGFVLSELLNQLHDKAEIKYWRTLAKAEVDFLILTGQEIVPVEVKYENFKEPKIERSLRSFIKEYSPKRAIVVTKDFWGYARVHKTKILFAPICYV